VVRRGVEAWVTAYLISVGVAAGNSDHNNAIAPVTNGVAALVPLNVIGLLLTPRLVMSSPDAISPCLPSERPRFD
jgi:hypothetical protein